MEKKTQLTKLEIYSFMIKTSNNKGIKKVLQPDKVIYKKTPRLVSYWKWKGCFHSIKNKRRYHSYSCYSTQLPFSHLCVCGGVCLSILNYLSVYVLQGLYHMISSTSLLDIKGNSSPWRLQQRLAFSYSKSTRRIPQGRESTYWVIEQHYTGWLRWRRGGDFLSNIKRKGITK